MIDRTTINTSGVINVLDRIEPAFVDRLALFVVERHPDVPLAEHPGLVASFLK